MAGLTELFGGQSLLSPQGGLANMFANGQQPTSTPPTSQSQPNGANPYPTGFQVGGAGANGASANWGSVWDPNTNSWGFNSPGGMLPIFTDPSQVANMGPMSGPIPGTPGNGLTGGLLTGSQDSLAQNIQGGYTLGIGNTDIGGTNIQYAKDPTTGYYIPKSSAGYGAWTPDDEGGLGGVMPFGLGFGLLGAGAAGLLGSSAGVGSAVSDAGPGAGALGGSAPIGNDALTNAFINVGNSYVPQSLQGLPQLAANTTDTSGGLLGGQIATTPAASQPGLAGLLQQPDTWMTTGGAGGAGGVQQVLGGGTGPGGFQIPGVDTGPITGAGMTPASLGTPGGGGFDLSSLLTPGGNNSLLNVQNLLKLGGGLSGMFNSQGLAGNLRQPYTTAYNNAQPGIQNLNQLLSAGPQGFYNTPIGQSLMATQIRDLNAKQSASGRFGIGAGGTIPSSGQGIDAANLLNQYMAQQYNNTVQTAAGAVSPLLSAINATYPGYNAGNVIGANSLNPLFSTLGIILGNNSGVQNAGNSALQYLWNGLG
jgi:hypothetical protein